MGKPVINRIIDRMVFEGIISTCIWIFVPPLLILFHFLLFSYLLQQALLQVIFLHALLLFDIVEIWIWEFVGGIILRAVAHEVECRETISSMRYFEWWVGNVLWIFLAELIGVLNYILAYISDGVFVWIAPAIISLSEISHTISIVSIAIVLLLLFFLVFLALLLPPFNL